MQDEDLMILDTIRHELAATDPYVRPLWSDIRWLVEYIDRLRAETARQHAIETAATKLLFDNGGPTGGDTYFGIPDEFVLAKIDDFQALESAVKSHTEPTSP